MSKVLVTGANGFVCSYVLEASLECPDIEWIAACRDPSKLPAGFSGRVRSGDLRDADYRL